MPRCDERHSCLRAGLVAGTGARAARGGAIIYGISEDAQLTERVPTICFNLPAIAPAAVTEAAARAGIGVRDGHMYSPRLMKRLGLAVETGAVRASLVHYNTHAEIHRFGDLLARLRPSRG